MKQISDCMDMILNIKIETIIDIVISIGIFAFFYIFSAVFAYAIIKIFKLRTRDKKIIKKMPFYIPLKVFFIVLGAYIAILVLKIPENILQQVNKAFKISIIILVANGLANTFNTDSELLSRLQTRFNIDEDDNRLNFIYKIIRASIYVVAALIIIMELGYNINGIIAGFGIGGVILTLAAQDTAKNVFGGLMLIIDKPFKVGDWIETTHFEGNVEDITFRSTRIRTFENSVVNIPNSILANESIINWSKMEKRRYKLDLKLSLDTSMDVIENLIDKIYFMLKNHSNVINDDTYVKFDEIKEDGIGIMIYVFTNSIDYASYLNAKEHINKNILEILEHENIKLAYPTSTIYVKND